MEREESTSGRRRFLRILIGAPIVFAAGVRLRWLDQPAFADRSPGAAPPTGGSATPTPECGDDDDPTPAQTEGPFYTPNTPRRTSLLEPKLEGERMVLTGRVWTRECRPIAGALLDFWHADHSGEYDNEGFRLRGHQFADAEGGYRLETIVPGLYGGRTRHFHVRVQAPGKRILTTQLYFPGEQRNRRDGIFRSDLLMAVNNATPKQAQFHFVLDVD